MAKYIDFKVSVEDQNQEENKNDEDEVSDN